MHASASGGNAIGVAVLIDMANRHVGGLEGAAFRVAAANILVNLLAALALLAGAKFDK